MKWFIIIKFCYVIGNSGICNDVKIPEIYNDFSSQFGCMDSALVLQKSFEKSTSDMNITVISGCKEKEE